MRLRCWPFDSLSERGSGLPFASPGDVYKRQRQESTQNLTDIPDLTLLEIEHFFAVYKDLEPGKSVEGAIWVGRADAENEVEASWDRARGTSYENQFTGGSVANTPQQSEMTAAEKFERPTRAQGMGE